MRRLRATTLAVLLLPLVAFGAACDDDAAEEAFDEARTKAAEGIDRTQTEIAELDDEESATPLAGGAERAAPEIRVVSPDADDRPDRGDVTVRVDVDGFDLADALGEAARSGQGHVHFYIDVAEVPTTPGRPAVTAQGTYHATAALEHTWSDVAPGTHTFAAQLVNNDHTPLVPPVFAQITVTVE
jgi:hypothetical protein